MSLTCRALSRAKAARGALLIGRPSLKPIGCTAVSSPWLARSQLATVDVSSTPGRPAATLRRVNSGIFRNDVMGHEGMPKQAVIGLLGGMSWESSAEYYRIINREV